MGLVSEQVLEKINLANEGKLPQATYNFNLHIGKVRTEDNYIRAYVINGYSRFKQYTLLDKIVYRLAQLWHSFTWPKK
jgi:hypothetical protein